MRYLFFLFCYFEVSHFRVISWGLFYLFNYFFKMLSQLFFLSLFLSPQVIKDSMRHKADLNDMSRMWVSAWTQVVAAGFNDSPLKQKLAQYNSLSLLNVALSSSLEFPSHCGNCQRVGRQAVSLLLIDSWIAGILCMSQTQ